MNKNIMKKFFNIFLITALLFNGVVVTAYQPVKKTTGECSRSIMKNYKDPVIFNINTRRWHEPSCRYSDQHKDAYYMERSEAKQKGVPCQICH